MRRTLGNLCATGALSLITLCAAVCAAADKRELTFDPPLTVSIRQTNGAIARGTLLNVTEQELLLRAVNGKDVTFKLDRIRFVKTSNDTFEYWPNKETFAELCQRADEVPNATLSDPAAPAGRGARRGNAVQRDEPDPADLRGERTPLARPGTAPTGNDILAPGRVGVAPGATRQQVRAAAADSKRQPPRRDPPQDETPPPTDDAADDPPAPGSAVYSCSNCMRDLPATVRSGQECPHCGEIIVFDEDSAESAATRDPTGDPFVAAGPATIPAPAPPVVAAAQPAAGGLSISEVPLLAKIGIFVGLLALGWIILQRR